MGVTVQQIKELRDETGAGMMDCKEALNDSGGDKEKAVIYLRKKGLADTKGRSHKAALEGMVGHYIHAGGKIGVIVEINCETDFVARSDDFQKFAKEVAMHVAASNPMCVSREEVTKEIIDREKEIIADSLKNKPPQIADKIVEGKLNKFFKDVCLLEQPFVRDNDITITDLLGELVSKIGEKVVIKRFVRYVVGE